MTLYDVTHQKYTPVKSGAVEKIGCDLSGRTRLPTKVAESDRGRGHQQSIPTLTRQLEVTVSVF